MTQCKYIEAWIGRCKEEALPGSEFCEKHDGKVCSSCGAPATHNCHETMGPMVCGEQLCDDCCHNISLYGVNEGPMPEGKYHVRRDDRLFLSWLYDSTNNEDLSDKEKIGGFIVTTSIKAEKDPENHSEHAWFSTPESAIDFAYSLPDIYERVGIWLKIPGKFNTDGWSPRCPKKFVGFRHDCSKEEFLKKYEILINTTQFSPKVVA